MNLLLQNKKTFYLLVFLTASLCFLLIPAKKVFAADSLSEGYGWGRTTVVSGKSNKIIYNIYDSVTGAPLQADSVSITLVEVYATSNTHSNINYTCNSAPCPSSHTFSAVPNNSPNGIWAVYSQVQKAGYHTSIDPGYYIGYGYSGKQVRTYSIYLTNSSLSYQVKNSFPAAGNWYSFDPTYTILGNPSFNTAGYSPLATTVTLKQDIYSLGPFSGPFPHTFSAIPAKGLADGIQGFGTGITQDDSGGENGALSGSAAGYNFGIDRSTPTVSCSLSPSGNTFNTTLTVTLNANDPLSGVGAGDLQVKINSGPWNSIGGNQLPPSYTYTATAGNTYAFQYRARNTSFDVNGLNTSWSSYSSCGSTTVLDTLDYINVNSSDTTSPVVDVSGATLAGNTVNTTPGTAVTFTFRTRNVGDSAATNNSCSVIEAFGSSVIGPANSCTATTTAGKQFYPVSSLAANSSSANQIMTTQWNSTGTYSMLFRVDAFGNVAESNLSGTAESNNDVVLTVNVVSPQDFSISLNISPSSIQQGSSTSAVVNVTPLLGYTGNITLSVAAVGNGISFGSFTPSVIANASGSSTFNISTSNPTTPLGNYTIIVTGTPDSSPPSAHSASSTLGVTAYIPKPWIQTTKGDVGSVGITPDSIKMVVPSGSGNSADYLVISNFAITNFNSAKNWLVGGYGNIKLPSPASYSDFSSKFLNSACPIPGSSGNIPDIIGMFVTSSDFTVSGEGGGTSCGSGKDATVVFVNGDLTISANLNSIRPLVLIVNGKILIDPSVSKINAVIITQGGFDDQAGNVQLTINGALFAGLDGTSSLTLSRDLGAADFNTPSEIINYDPRYLYLLNDLLGISPTVFQDVAD